MAHDGRVGVLGHRAEVLDITVAEGIGNLKSGAQQHREDEEDRHAFLLEESECAESERVDPRLAFPGMTDRTARQREGVDRENQGEDGRNVQLPIGQFDLYAAYLNQIDEPHGGDEADRAPDPDGREVLHGIEFRQVEGIVGHRVREGDGGHVEHDAHQHAGVQGSVGGLRGGCDEEPGADELADAQQLLRGDPAVGDDTHEGRHEERCDTHRSEETADLQPCELKSSAEVGAQRNEPRTPDRVLQEVHDDKTEFDSHNWLIYVLFYFCRPFFPKGVMNKSINFFRNFLCS